MLNMVAFTVLLSWWGIEGLQINDFPPEEISSDHYPTYHYEPTESQPTMRGIRSWVHLPSRLEDCGVPDDQRDIIMSASVDYVVPSRFLYGIWTMESARLDKDWRDFWPLAADMPVYGSPCCRSYRYIKCRDRYRALERICRQERNGQPICDPQQVRTSHAIACGPTQHLSIFWSPAEGQWGSHVVDYDRDGVYDPHSLADAMASTARHLRQNFLRHRRRGENYNDAWRYAIRNYLGVDRPCRYERGVYRHARQWATVRGHRR